MYNVCILCKGVFIYLPLLDCFPDSTLILVHLLVLVLLQSGQICKNISNKKVYKTQGYTSVINTCADQSMSRAVDEVKASPQYITNGGEVHMCECILLICK